MKWLPGLIVERECLEMDRSWRVSYSGSYGSLGTQYALNGLMYKISIYGGSQGSLGRHIVAPRAHWGHRTYENG